LLKYTLVPKYLASRTKISDKAYLARGAAIAKMFERTLLKKVGPEKLNDSFLALDTICDATQERQV